ncbi:MAG: type III-A CRISPR-associated RAMP protein Csm4 [Scytolyngbya sp. HA4215-MV1]|jgi:CRISPR-associated protein Csm4|nr:type III-A CRISPR-associated RAMP protein Csm4 [Scytolyngbya sp. HA4215-MV1]
MSRWQLVKLDFGRNPVHFGEVGIGMEESSERAYSDTLFSAWVSSYARLFGGEAVEQLFSQFPQPERSPRLEPPFRLSSTFIYHGETYYLPRPIKPPKGYPTENLAFAKEYKKLDYLPLSVWQRWYQGKGFTNSDTNSDRAELELKVKQSKTGGALERAQTFGYSKAFESQRIPKVSLDRTTRASNFYHVGFVQFQPEAGLYFLIHFPTPDPALETRLASALSLLGEDGIGGERSSGAGRFTATWHDLDKNWGKVVGFKQPNAYSLISLLWEYPFASEYLQGASYALRERSGWIVSPVSGQQARRQSVQMFTEGSVFSQPIGGLLAKVTPEKFKAHPIYRSGISLSLPIQLAVP